MSRHARRLMFVVTEDWYFVSHRLALAAAAREAGYEVSVVTRVRDHGATIEAAGIRVISWEQDRGGLNPLREAVSVRRLAGVYRREKPDLVHHVALKPALIGGLAARIAGVPRVINAVAGMGWLYSSGAGLAGTLRPLVRFAMRRLLNSTSVFALVQNPDDQRIMAELGVPAGRLCLVPGSGIDLTRFPVTAEPEGVPVVVLPARMLFDKGVRELVDAARLLHARGVRVRIVLAGTPDPQNRASIPPTDIAGWVRDGLVEWPGWVADMPAMLAAAHIVCLPSYREGLPKALLEAAAAGRPIITTDVPGCREVVRDGENGLLVPARDATALAAAIERLVCDRPLRLTLGLRGRARAEREWASPVVIAQILALYAKALA